MSAATHHPSISQLARDAIEDLGLTGADRAGEDGHVPHDQELRST